MSSIQDLKLRPNPIQKRSPGWRYGFKLYQNGQMKLNYVSGEINERYYVETPEFTQKIHDFFEKIFHAAKD
ncbi:hypothetical protein [Paenibacillus shirakamiensis]|uniref:hypothetical protein n=1 Tax=Paenibacillus shirakamiensis TaxID=1265935 RepID=UPI001AE93BC8|nr:hypothetical protein [Paenibacillus shirakamiensis]